jgi:hypothetical protein
MRDLNATIPGAPNFKYKELIKSTTATTLGISNVPLLDKEWENLEYLAKTCLQPARDYFGIPIVLNSGYRGPELNKAVNGSKASFHVLGCAADIDFGNKVKSPSLFDLFSFFYNYTPYTELIAEELPGGWIHIAIQKGREQEKQLKYKLVHGPVKRADFNTISGFFNS